MNFDQVVVLSLFLSVFAGIISEKIDKTLLVIGASLFLLLTGFLQFDEAIHAIDFHTIILLLGMMLIVEALKAIKLFDWLSIQLGLITRGSPILIFGIIGLSTAFLSAFLDNVTTVLVVAPLMITLTQGVGLPPKVFVLSVIFFSNLGGAATLIGDPPNILIGSQVPELTFAMFLQYLSVPVVLSCGALYFLTKWRHPELIKSRDKNFTWLFTSGLLLQDLRRRKKALLIPRDRMIKAAVILIVVMGGFFSHAATHIEPSIIALLGAALFFLAFQRQIDLHHTMEKVEWGTLLFFAGLFIVVGGMEKVGILELIAHGIAGLTDNLLVLMLVILVSSAVLSALVDNIPFVAGMIPVLKEVLQSPAFAQHPKAQLLWWALALGACFGGNGSIIGASANVVTCAIAKSRGVDISFIEFVKEALPITTISIAISAVYLSALYFA